MDFKKLRKLNYFFKFLKKLNTTFFYKISRIVLFYKAYSNIISLSTFYLDKNEKKRFEKLLLSKDIKISVDKVSDIYYKWKNKKALNYGNLINNIFIIRNIK